MNGRCCMPSMGLFYIESMSGVFTQSVSHKALTSCSSRQILWELCPSYDGALFRETNLGMSRLQDRRLRYSRRAWDSNVCFIAKNRCQMPLVRSLLCV